MANELLTGLLGQPKGPAAPGTTQNSYGGTVPSPVAQPPQTPGFQNQTNNPQWWGGAGGGPATTGAPAPLGATSGYGSSTPTPDTGTGTETGTETDTGTTTPPAPPPDNSAVKKAKMNIQRSQQTILQYKKQIVQYQGTEYGDKIQRYLQQLMLDVQHWQSIIDSGGAGYR